MPRPVLRKAGALCTIGAWSWLSSSRMGPTMSVGGELPALAVARAGLCWPVGRSPPLLWLLGGALSWRKPAGRSEGGWEWWRSSHVGHHGWRDPSGSRAAAQSLGAGGSGGSAETVRE